MSYPSYPQAVLSLMEQYKQTSAYNELHWEGTLVAEYLEILRQRPQILKNSFQRIYQMILAARTEEYFENKEKLILNSLTNMGQPIIKIVDGNFQNRGELLLAHQHEGVEFKWDFVHETLINLFRLWKRPVHVETKKLEKKVRLSYDGKEHQYLSLE